MLLDRRHHLQKIAIETEKETEAALVVEVLAEMVGDLTEREAILAVAAEVAVRTGVEERKVRRLW